MAIMSTTGSRLKDYYLAYTRLLNQFMFMHKTKPPLWSDGTSEEYFKWWSVECSKCGHNRFHHTDLSYITVSSSCRYLMIPKNPTLCNCPVFSNFEEMISNLTLKENEDEEDNDVLDLAFEPNKLNICH